MSGFLSIGVTTDGDVITVRVAEEVEQLLVESGYSFAVIGSQCCVLTETFDEGDQTLLQLLAGGGPRVQRRGQGAAFCLGAGGLLFPFFAQFESFGLEGLLRAVGGEVVVADEVLDDGEFVHVSSPLRSRRRFRSLVCRWERRRAVFSACCGSVASI